MCVVKDMPKLIIDEQEIEVPAGTKVIEAAERLGIMIPRFCYHPALGSVGACRVCAVKFLQGPFKGLQMSCMIDAADGMVVSTTDQEVVEFRKYVIEWLMLNHPHDCPVCDEGGHCLLQDTTIAGGHGLRRYRGKKRTHVDQYLGPLIQHEMNRCIQCYRCSRFYQEFSGYRDLGVMQIGRRVYFGRYQAGTLESPFAGNLADICPTGVFTDKPSRFIGRRWDYERSPSLCINCSLGCHTVISARYREVVRQEARFSRAINGYFICDRGRYGFAYASLAERPRQACIDGKAASWQESLRTALEGLGRISTESGPAAVACVGSARSSLETQVALRRLCRTQGWQGPVYWLDHDIAINAKTAVSMLDNNLTVSLRDLEKADYILAVGADPVNEAPMLALALRQAQRSGAKVALLDPRPIDLPFDFSHLPAALPRLAHYLALLLKDLGAPDTIKRMGLDAHEFSDAAAAESGMAIANREMMAAVAEGLRQSRRPVIVCGTQVVPATVPALAADIARLLNTMNKQAGLFYLLPGANAFGAVLLSDTAATFEQILAGIESGDIKALVLVESDPYWHFADRPRLERALERLELLIVLDYLDSRTVQAADVFLPTLTLYETGGFFINQEGRVQKAPVAFQGGRPVSQVSGGSHPPRTFRSDIPGTGAKAAWEALAEFGAGLSEPEKETKSADATTWLAQAHPLFADLAPKDAFPDNGVRLSLGPDRGIPVQSLATVSIKDPGPAGSLELITVDWTFGTEELSARSPYLGQVEKEPCVLMQSADAARLGLADGDNIVVRSDAGEINVPVAVKDNMASGTLVLPRHRRLVWQYAGAASIALGKDRIFKAGKDES